MIGKPNNVQSLCEQENQRR